MIMRFKFLAVAAIIIAVCIQSCVPTKQLKDLEQSCTKERTHIQGDLKSCEELSNEQASRIYLLNRAMSQLRLDSTELSTDLAKKIAELERTNKKYDALQSENEYLLNNMNSSAKNLLKDYQNLKGQLLAREDSINAKELQIEERNRKIEELNSLLSQQSQELKNLKAEVISALKGYDGQGIDIVEKDGKIYVLMDESLLFNSGSYTVSSKGKTAIAKLGHVLAQNKKINVLIEGHTDNDPYNGSGQLKDNWDLSVMRATSVVKILLDDANIDASRITACGHGEYMPITDNSTPEAKAKNRRTEIILSPNLQRLFELLEKY